MKHLDGLAGVALGALACLVASAASAQQAPTWTDVSPIFAANCFSCHGGIARSGGLQLDSYAAAIAGGHDGPVLLAGDPDDSLLMKRIRGQIPPRMPRDAAPLSVDEIRLIAAWIVAGMPER